MGGKSRSRRNRRKKIPLRERLRREFPGESKERLLARLLCGEVCVDGQVCREPSYPVSADVRVAFHSKRFVSRGGEKLSAALQAWNLEVGNRVFLDAGASAGGFTDALLQAGARRVYAVDVGFNQLAWKLRQDSRVVAWERTNIMELSPGDFSPPPQAAAADLSFRSLRGAAAHILDMTEESWMVALMKPQFEWRSPAEDFDGVVRSEERRRELLAETAEALGREGVSLDKWMDSPIPGRRGNREYLLLLRRTPPTAGEDPCGRGAPQ